MRRGLDSRDAPPLLVPVRCFSMCDPRALQGPLNARTQGLTTYPINRRQFLQAGAAGAIALALPPQRAYAAPLAGGSTLEITGSEFPRAFVFRQSEVLANLRSYGEWEAAFLPLEGILGKVLQEERTDTVTARNAAYFAEFKRRNPSKLVLAHVNGQAWLADFVGPGWWPGFWLYRVGATLTVPLSPADGSATASDRPIRLAYPRPIRR